MFVILLLKYSKPEFLCACACVENKMLNTALMYYRWGVLEDGLILALVFCFGGKVPVWREHRFRDLSVTDIAIC